MFGLGPGELAAILIAVVVLFGAKRLPELARGMGESVREFRRSLHDPIRANENSRDHRASPSGGESGG